MNGLSGQKKRQEYLRKKRIDALLMLGQGVLMLLSLLLMAALVLSPWWAGEGGSTWLDFINPILMAMACVPGYFVLTLLRSIREPAQIPFVPPVTPSTLPSDEILVRGSVEPDAPQETLLRAAQGAEEMRAEELLRSSGRLGSRS